MFFNKNNPQDLNLTTNSTKKDVYEKLIEKLKKEFEN